MSAVFKKSPQFCSDPFNEVAPSYGGDPMDRLIAAARSNDIPNIKLAVVEGANKYGYGSTGENFYTAAAEGNALSAIDYGWAELHVAIDTADRNGRTGLLAALQKAHPLAAAKFLGYGANPLEVGKHSRYQIIDCFIALEEALQKDMAVQNGVVNELWSPVVAGMMHRLFNPQLWPDDKGVVWDRHIPEFIQRLTLSSGVTIASMRDDRAAAAAQVAGIPLSELNA